MARTFPWIINNQLRGAKGLTFRDADDDIYHFLGFGQLDKAVTDVLKEKHLIASPTDGTIYLSQIANQTAFHFLHFPYDYGSHREVVEADRPRYDSINGAFLDDFVLTNEYAIHPECRAFIEKFESAVKEKKERKKVAELELAVQRA